MSFGTLFPVFEVLVPKLRRCRFCAVGDVVTRNALQAGLVPEIAVIDGITQRGTQISLEKIYTNEYMVENPAGTITDDLVAVLRDSAVHTPALVTVRGEEDLALLPLITMIPDGWHVIYGQPGQGTVLCEVDGPLREKIYRILAEFERKD